MAKEATLQVRMDAELVMKNRMPFVMSADSSDSTYGRLSKYADPQKTVLEDAAFETAAIEKHVKTD